MSEIGDKRSIMREIVMTSAYYMSEVIGQIMDLQIVPSQLQSLVEGRNYMYFLHEMTRQSEAIFYHLNLCKSITSGDTHSSK